MAPNITLTSYATPYDTFIGQRDISSLHADDADRLIRETFAKDGDARGLVMEWNVRKDQAEGLWFLVISLGLRLERQARIKDFQERTETDVQAIIAALDGTQLRLRVEEAYPPFDHLTPKSPYDWSELAELAASTDYLVETVEELIEQGDLAVARNVHAGIFDRLSFEQLHNPRNKGRWSLAVDRGLAYRVAPRIKTGWLGWASLICPLIFIASIPVMIWLNLWAGLAMIVVGIVILKWSAVDLRKRIFDIALADRDEYRWLQSRRIVWVSERR